MLSLDCAMWQAQAKAFKDVHSIVLSDFHLPLHYIWKGLWELLAKKIFQHHKL